MSRIEATAEQKSTAFRDTESVLQQCKELCNKLGIPLSEIRLAHEIYSERLGSIILSDERDEAEKRRMLSRSA